MQTLEAIHTRRAVRAFTADPISEEDLQNIVAAAAAAPSGSNAQTWAFIGIRDPRRIAAMRALSPGIIGVPAAVIVLCLDTRSLPADTSGSLDRLPYYNLGAAMQNILLAAHDLGFGGCPVGSFHPGGLRVFLDLPDAVEPCLLIVVGKPKFQPGAPRKRALTDIYFRERYEVPNEHR